jgi:GMP synthase (glutamine-hydrolysing)
MADEARHFYGVQFHPEVTHTVQGKAMLHRFVHQICQARADWVMTGYVEEAVTRIRAQVGDEEVILGLSGGVDSSVAAALIHRAIGDQLTCVFVDHGLLRLNEGDAVMDMFAGRLHARVIRVDASALFLGKLAGVSDPEAKRKIIGSEFVTVFKEQAAKLKAGNGGHKGATFLAQGTIYPDVIESGGAHSKKAVTIKSHHNVICSKTKCVNSAWRWVCHTTWSIGIRFQARVWVFGFWVKSKRNMPICFGVPMPYSSKNYATRPTKE